MKRIVRHCILGELADKNLLIMEDGAGWQASWPDGWLVGRWVLLSAVI